jgi:hypothetical protein
VRDRLIGRSPCEDIKRAVYEKPKVEPLPVETVEALARGVGPY